MKNLFEEKGMNETIERINQLNANTTPEWGKMNVAQMLAHNCIAYEIAFDERKVDRPGFFGKIIMNLFVKSTVIGNKPYSKNGQTAPYFIVDDERDFEVEKKRLIDYIERAQKIGARHFEGKESASFGKITSAEWNTMFSKHIDHHLVQFGV